MGRVHVCSYVGPHGESCPELAVNGRSRCARHATSKSAGWAHRDNNKAEHMRWARAAKRAQPACQVCGATERLEAHHLPDGSPMVLCAAHHRAIDRHSRGPT